MKRIILILLVLLLVISGAAGSYFYQQRTIDDPQTKNDSLSNDIKKLRADMEKLKSDADTNKNETQASTSTTYKSEKGSTIIVTSPANGAVITSPLKITGSVPGSWSFEAQFTVRLYDSRGKLLDESPATLQGDWMTDELVPFTATLTFISVDNQAGTLTLVKSNPSGLTENNDSVEIPIKFE